MGFSIFKKKGDEIDEVEAAAAEQQIDTSPQPEEPQKINKGILYVVIFLIAAVMGYALFSGGDKKKNDAEDRAVVTQQDLLPDERLVEIERKERENRGNGKDKVPGDKPGTNPTAPQNPNAKIAADPQQSQVNSSVQPPPIVPSSPQISEIEMRQREKAEKRADEREKEAREGQRSGIFFTLSKDKDRKEHKPTQAESVNDYYNNQGYIEIVGGNAR